MCLENLFHPATLRVKERATGGTTRRVSRPRPELRRGGHVSLRARGAARCARWIARCICRDVLGGLLGFVAMCSVDCSDLHLSTAGIRVNPIPKRIQVNPESESTIFSVYSPLGCTIPCGRCARGLKGPVLLCPPQHLQISVALGVFTRPTVPRAVVLPRQSSGGERRGGRGPGAARWTECSLIVYITRHL